MEHNKAMSRFFATGDTESEASSSESEEEVKTKPAVKQLVQRYVMSANNVTACTRDVAVDVQFS